MADTIPTHYATEFSTNWIHRVQQTSAYLDAFVEDENFSGERKRYDRLTKQTSRRRTERKAQTPVTDTSTDFRWCYRKTYDLANLLAEEDARNLAPLVLPQSDYVKSHAMAYARDCDQTVINAALGSVITGEAGTTVTGYDSTNQLVSSDSDQTAEDGTGSGIGAPLFYRAMFANVVLSRHSDTAWCAKLVKFLAVVGVEDGHGSCIGHMDMGNPPGVGTSVRRMIAWAMDIRQAELHNATVQATYVRHFRMAPMGEVARMHGYLTTGLRVLHLPKKVVLSMARFRLSSHNLRIETGRHEGLPRSERSCCRCKRLLGENFVAPIDDEEHLLFSCEGTKDIRLRFSGLPMSTLRDLMEFEDVCRVAWFVHECMIRADNSHTG